MEGWTDEAIATANKLPHAQVCQSSKGVARAVLEERRPTSLLPRPGFQPPQGESHCFCLARHQDVDPQQRDNNHSEQAECVVVSSVHVSIGTLRQQRTSNAPPRPAAIHGVVGSRCENWLFWELDKIERRNTRQRFQIHNTVLFIQNHYTTFSVDSFIFDAVRLYRKSLTFLHSRRETTMMGPPPTIPRLGGWCSPDLFLVPSPLLSSFLCYKGQRRSMLYQSL